MRLGLIVVAALLAAFVLAGSAEAADSREPCHKTKTTTVKRNAHVRVYRRTDNRVFACHIRDRRALFLGHSGTMYASDFQSLSIIRLAGRFVSFDEAVGCDRHYGDCEGGVVVLDARTGKRKHALRVGDTRLAGEPRSQLPEVLDLALRPNGSAALIIGPTDAGEREVWKLDSEGKVRLDHGTDVERGSLAISARLVYWRRGGQAFSAPLR